MGYRLSKITTRTGDDGTTGLGPKNRLSKDDVRIEVLGTLDELNSVLGLILAHNPADTEIEKSLQHIQQDLFNLGGELCPPYHPAITEEKLLRLDNWIADWNAMLPPLSEFILPGGNLLAAQTHVARTVCRRAERRLVSLHRVETLNPQLLQYMNRLSDLLFIVARIFARKTSEKEVMWQR